MEGWQPIETAPDDDGELLLGDGERVTVGYLWRDEMWLDVLDGNREFHPTHWQPLPEPPEPAK